MAQLSPFAQKIFSRTYEYYPNETWNDCARRVAKAVANDHQQEEKFYVLIRDRIMIPGGRYLWSSGRPKFMNANCYGLVAGDSRESWAQLLHDVTMCLSTGGGLGVNYSAIRASGDPIKTLGGTASGPLALIQMVNEVARYVMAGGKRRSALWAGLHWSHPDIEKFITLKDWNADYREMKSKNFEYFAPSDMTNVSVIIDQDYLTKLANGDPHVSKLHGLILDHMLRHGEPGFWNISRVQQDDPVAETANACLPAHVLFLTHTHGFQRLDALQAGEQIWTGKRWATLSQIWSTGTKPVYRYWLSNGLILDCTQDHVVLDHQRLVQASEAKAIDTGIADGTGTGQEHPFPIVAGLAQGDGTTTHGSGQVNNVWIYIGQRDQDVAEYLDSTGLVKAISESDEHHTTAYIVDISPETLHVPRRKLTERNIDTFWLTAHPATTREFLRGLFSANGNVLGHHTRIALKTSNHTLAGQVQLMLGRLGYRAYITTNKPQDIQWPNGRYLSKESYNVNIAGYDQCQKFAHEIGFLQKYKMLQFTIMIPPKYVTSRPAKVIRTELLGEMEVFDFTVNASEHTASVNGIIVHNCTESCLHDRDTCNLMSIALPRIQTLSHLEEVTRQAIQFLYNGSMKATYPTEQITTVVQRNRRLGLGLMGLHEFMLLHNHPYEWFPELESYLKTWKDVADDEARKYAIRMHANIPVATRAIAPTGTISIIGETTSGIEPIFCRSYKRRYIDGDKHYYQYVIDPTTKRLLDLGIPAAQIEDAHTLAKDIPRRLHVQAHTQRYVDQAISNTINLDIPEWTPTAPIETAITHALPFLKGLTVYPNNSRAGQPLVPIAMEDALSQEGVVFEERGECTQGVCGL